MKTNVKPGMLAYLVSPQGFKPNTPEIIGRIVFVEREVSSQDVFTHVDGRMMRNTFQSSDSEKIWVISAKEPLPSMVTIPGEPVEKWYTYERPMLDSCLRPLLDPDLGITDEEVDELYATKEKEVA